MCTKKLMVTKHLCKKKESSGYGMASYSEFWIHFIKVIVVNQTQSQVCSKCDRLI